MMIQGTSIIFSADGLAELPKVLASDYITCDQCNKPVQRVILRGRDFVCADCLQARAK